MSRTGKSARRALLPLLMLLSAPLWAADHQVVLKKKAFEPETLAIKVGDSVTFRNEDSFEHTLQSQSEAKTFELDALANGESKKLSFDKPGKVEVDCGQHGSMHLTIQVSR